MDADDADLDKVGNLSVKSSTTGFRQAIRRPSEPPRVLPRSGPARRNFVDSDPHQAHRRSRRTNCAFASPGSARIASSRYPQLERGGRTAHYSRANLCDPAQSGRLQSLSDTPGNATFSERRPQTVELIKQEARRLLERLPLLLECCA
jgi:hypothetical protein